MTSLLWFKLTNAPQHRRNRGLPVSTEIGKGILPCSPEHREERLDDALALLTRHARNPLVQALVDKARPATEPF